MKKAIIEKLSSVIEQQDVYGPPPDSKDTELGNSMIKQEALYGPPPDKKNTELENINIGILIVLFILGVFALLNKKISKKSKYIIVISLIIIGIITTLVIKYFSTL